MTHGHVVKGKKSQVKCICIALDHRKILTRFTWPGKGRNSVRCVCVCVYGCDTNWEPFERPQVQVSRRPWLYEGEDGRQVGGFVKEFNNLAFLTVKVNTGANDVIVFCARRFNLELRSGSSAGFGSHGADRQTYGGVRRLLQIHQQATLLSVRPLFHVNEHRFLIDCFLLW